MVGLQKGREAGTRKTGGATKGAVIKQTLDVRAAILRVFEEFNENDDFLKDLAINDKKLFLGLLARVLPQAQEIEVDQKVTVNIGAAMDEASLRLKSQYMADLKTVPHVEVPKTLEDAQRIYGEPGEQPLPDPNINPDIYRVEPQERNRELWAGYEDEPKPGQHRRRRKA